jgi:hypothetical protein
MFEFRKFIVGLLFLQFLSCSKKVSSFQTATLWGMSTGAIPQYSLKIPKKCNCQYYAQEGAREKIYTYPDSSYIFLANNITMGLIPREVVKIYGQKVFIMFTRSNDTTTIGIDGVDSTGRFWNIKRSGGAIYGYQRVPASNRNKFDSVLKSLSTHFVSSNPGENPDEYKNMGLIGGSFLAKCKNL